MYRMTQSSTQMRIWSSLTGLDEEDVEVLWQTSRDIMTDISLTTKEGPTNLSTVKTDPHGHGHGTTPTASLGELPPPRPLGISDGRDCLSVLCSVDGFIYDAYRPDNFDAVFYAVKKKSKVLDERVDAQGQYTTIHCTVTKPSALLEISSANDICNEWTSSIDIVVWTRIRVVAECLSSFLSTGKHQSCVVTLWTVNISCVTECVRYCSNEENEDEDNPPFRRSHGGKLYVVPFLGGSIWTTTQFNYSKQYHRIPEIRHIIIYLW